jgi:C_GCAxxG_C_C family probable redox protein
MAPKTKAEAVKKAYDQVFVCTPKHHSCSLGAMAALQEAFGIHDESAFKAASGMRGGIGRKGDICGTFTGASLMLGLMCGPTIEESGAPQENHDPYYLDKPTKLVGELYDWFKAEFGTLVCNQLLEKQKQALDADPSYKGLTESAKLDKMHDLCHLMGAKTAARAAEMLWDESHAKK